MRTSQEAPGRLFPWWLSGVTAAGLVVPDLLTWGTGHVSPFSTVTFWLVYSAAALLAISLAPAPRRRALRLVDVALVFFLPYV